MLVDISQGQRDPLKSMRLYNVKVISTDIFGTKRATGDPRVSKRPDFQGLFRFPKKIEFLNCGFQDFWISSFFWISGHIFGTRRATGDPLVSKRPKFLGLYRFTKKSYRRSAGVEMTEIFRALQIYKKI